MLRVVVVAALIAYPFIILEGMERLGTPVLAVLLGALLLARMFLGGSPLGGRARALVVGLVLAMIAVMLMSDDSRVLKSYPVMVSLGLFGVFGVTLLRGPTIIERILRSANRPAPEHAAGYLWWVTLTWTIFFAVNAGIALWTALFAPTRIWALYNGLVSYLLIALLFSLEWLFRQFYRRRITANE